MINPKIKKAQLVEGPIGRTLTRLTIPMFFGVLGMVAFNLVDTFFVGRLGTRELAAMSFTFPIIFIINGISMGIGTGASAVISRAIGSGDHLTVRRLTTHSLALALLLVGIFVGAGLFSIDPVFRLLGATDNLLPRIREYMRVWYMGTLFVVFPMVGNDAIRATGDTKTPSLIMLLAVVVNCILDPLLIFGIGPFPRMELAGAALATVIARATTFFVAVIILQFRDHMLTWRHCEFRFLFKSWRQILYIGLPSGASNIIIPVGIGIITRLVASYGPAAVAALGVASRIETFAMTVVTALAIALSPFIGQNLGAANCQRVQRGLQISQRFAFLWGIGMLALLTLSGGAIGRFFTSNPDVIRIIRHYFWIVPIGYGLQGLLSVSSATLNVLHQPLKSTALLITQMFVLTIPLAYLGSYLFGLNAIFGASTFAKVATGLAAIWVLRREIRTCLERTARGQNPIS
jgi:putative MATE family efflux protein